LRRQFGRLHPEFDVQDDQLPILLPQRRQRTLVAFLCFDTDRRFEWGGFLHLGVERNFHARRSSAVAPELVDDAVVQRLP
jgi:hypothetical protein